MFNIRAISLTEGAPAGARVALDQYLGREVEFRRGISVRLTLPMHVEAFSALVDPEMLLVTVERWSRVYSFVEDDRHSIHLLSPAEDGAGGLLFYRLDMLQPVGPRGGPRPAVEVTGGAVLDFDGCGAWLVDLAERWRSFNKDKAKVVIRPVEARLWRPRLAWVGPGGLDGATWSSGSVQSAASMAARLIMLRQSRIGM